MLETGLALIACCLPTLTALGRSTLLQAFVKSMRSLVSLPSSGSGLRSKLPKSHLSHETTKRNRDRSNGSSTSQIAMVTRYSKDARIETFVIGDTPKVLHKETESGDEVIWVDTRMDRQENLV